MPYPHQLEGSMRLLVRAMQLPGACKPTFGIWQTNNHKIKQQSLRLPLCFFNRFSRKPLSVSYFWSLLLLRWYFARVVFASSSASCCCGCGCCCGCCCINLICHLALGITLLRLLPQFSSLLCCFFKFFSDLDVHSDNLCGFFPLDDAWFEHHNADSIWFCSSLFWFSFFQNDL